MNTRAAPLPGLTGRAMLWFGATLSLAVLLVLAAAGWTQHASLVQAERRHAALMVRVLEDHATRSVESAALALAVVGERLVLLAARGQDGVRPASPKGLTQATKQATAPAISPGMTQAIAQALADVNFLRSVAVLDAAGEVLASSDAADLGRRVDLARLGAWPPVGRDRIGTLVPGRGLDAIDSTRAAPSVPAGVGFVPLMRHVLLRSGEQRLVLGLLNPDAFANQQQLTVGDEETGAVLASYAGDVLVTTPSVAAAAGATLRQHPVFTDRLPAQEHGSYVGAGLRSGQQIVAFRVSRTRPLVLLVEQPMGVVWRAWWATMRPIGGAGAALLIFLAAATALSWRSLRNREAAARHLQRAQADVARSERELAVTIKSLQELIFRTDAAGAIGFVNQRWFALAGTDPATAVGRYLWDLVPPEQRQAVRALFATGGDAGVRAMQVLLPDSHGAWRSFDLSLMPLQHAGTVVGFAGSAVDVTERVVAQQRLQAQLAFSGLLMETSPQPMSVASLDGRYLLVNRAWEAFTGRSRTEVVGSAVGAGRPPEAQRAREARDRELAATGEPQRFETTERHQDGSVRDVVIDKVLLPGEDGRPGAILNTMIDVSEFRDAERATREARDAAEEASRAKSEFIANISHELRTPLQSIIGFSELGTARARAHDKLAAMFSDIHAAGQRMLSLVNDLLDVAKIESTVGTIHLERSDLRGLVREVVHELQPLLAQRRQLTELQLPEHALLAKVDPLRFQQMVRNLLANAVKFSPEGGTIELTLAAGEPGEIVLCVSDRGPGIPAAELETIFEAFVQSSHTKDGAGGTGLGLAICRKIAEAHGGSIVAENRPGGGAIFRLRLPRRASGETLPAPL